MRTELAFLAFGQRLEGSLDSCLRASDADGDGYTSAEAQSRGRFAQRLNVPVEGRLGLGVLVTAAAYSPCKGDSIRMGVVVKVPVEPSVLRVGLLD